MYVDCKQGIEKSLGVNEINGLDLENDVVVLGRQAGEAIETFQVLIRTHRVSENLLLMLLPFADRRFFSKNVGHCIIVYMRTNAKGKTKSSFLGKILLSFVSC